MKILEIVFTLSSGGAERFVVDLSNELSKSNDIILMTLKNECINSHERQFYKYELSERVRYINLGLDDGFKLSSQWRIYRAIKHINPEIIHLHGGNMARFCALAIALLNGKYKFFQTIHNDLHHGYDKGGNRFIYNFWGNKKRYHLIAISETNYKDLKEFYPKCNVCCIVNGRSAVVPSEKYNDVKAEIQKYKQNTQTMVFLHIARCSKQKNQELLIDAFNILYQEKCNVSLVVIGSGYDSELGWSLRQRANENIHFIGTKTNIPDYLLNSNIFVLSSSYEGMPITLLEACLAGIPCVSTPVCGAIDLIKDKETGVLSEDFSLTNFIKALKTAIADYCVLQKNAQTKQTAPYQIEVCANSYMQYFKSIK